VGRSIRLISRSESQLERTEVEEAKDIFVITHSHADTRSVVTYVSLKESQNCSPMCPGRNGVQVSDHNLHAVRLVLERCNRCYFLYGKITF